MNKRLPQGLALLLLIAASVADAGKPAPQPQPTPTGPTPISQCKSITQPGPYVLTTNLSSTGDCLVVASNYVHIDLAGFTISGSGAGSGIARLQGVGQEGSSVRNGTILGFNRGVDFQFTQRCTVENVQAVHNTEFGIIGYDACRIENNQVAFNGTGIAADDGSLVNGNSVRGNTYDGLIVDGLGSIAQGNTVTVNQRSGIIAGANSTLIGNIVYASGHYGIEAACPVNLINNTVTNSSLGSVTTTGVGCVDNGNLLQ